MVEWLFCREELIQSSRFYFMNTKWRNAFALAASTIAVVLVAVHNLDFKPTLELLNVSYAPTADLYQAVDRQFAADYAKQKGMRLTLKLSNGGSSLQAQAVINGLEADVVTLALPSDVDALRKHGLIPEGWAERLPNHSSPYSSTIIFVVRHGNPKRIHDWADLTGPGVAVVTPSVLEICRSGWAVSVSVSVAVLFAAFGSAVVEAIVEVTVEVAPAGCV